MAEDEAPRKSIEEIEDQIVPAIQSLFTATKTALMYPSENPSVVRAVSTARTTEGFSDGYIRAVLVAVNSDWIAGTIWSSISSMLFLGASSSAIYYSPRPASTKGIGIVQWFLNCGRPY